MGVAANPWKSVKTPKRILAIRLQAMGDTMITLPYLNALRKTLPLHTQLDFLTREEVADVPMQLQLFDTVYRISGGRNERLQLVYTALLLPQLLLNRYDIVVDLQNNRTSNFVLKALRPKAWTLFDRFSPLPAGERTRLTIEKLGLNKNYIDTNLVFKQQPEIDRLLKANGWDGESNLMVLNPAGAFTTRNWPIEHYVDFALLWLQAFPNSQFMMVGVAFIAGKAAYLKHQLGDKLIDLVYKTSAAKAFALVKRAQLVLSEDSGLMHMAWVQGVPTIAIFGSTRSDWSAPLGDRSLLLGSNDLPCGNCLLEHCKYDDVHCLTRYTPQKIFDKAVKLLGLEDDNR